MKINIERLIGAVQEHFDNVRDLKIACKKPYWKWTEEENRTYIRRERDERGSNNGVSDLCSILGMDICKLYIMARIARKWETKCNWQKCFPIAEHQKAILEFLEKSETFDAQSEISYIHWKINNAERINTRGFLARKKNIAGVA